MDFGIRLQRYGWKLFQNRKLGHKFDRSGYSYTSLGVEGWNGELKASAMITGVPVETSILISAFPRVPLTEKEIWMDEHFHSIWETAVDWNSDDQSKGYDGDGLTNEESGNIEPIHF